MAGVRGSFNLAAELARRLRAIDSPQFRQQFNARLAATAVRQVDVTFQRQVDPYDKAWPPLQHPSAKRGGASAIALRDTGRLAASYHGSATSNGFAVDTNTDYAAAHQYGARMEAHSRLGKWTMRFDRNGRLTSGARARRLTFIDERTITRRTYMQGWTLPRRQMVPEVDTGGVGDRWGNALNDEADKALRDHMDVP